MLSDGMFDFRRRQVAKLAKKRVRPEQAEEMLSKDFLLRKLVEECFELVEAVLTKDVVSIVEESVDVANTAEIIYRQRYRL